NCDMISCFNYFDKQSNAQKPIYIGVYKNNTIISALTHILQMGDKYRYKTNVVYTGIKINEISEVDPTTLNYTLDFYLLFRVGTRLSPKILIF
ncbi:MAG: hypothetical protein VSS75_034185, partial [Candidatus Parabeggiatoa sp.]|nr:hypothetical protein [Candidatus Parabeggiatoa sp.]